MNTLTERGLVQELDCGSNFSYVLADNKSFLPVEYKVLQNKSDDGFIKCVKMLFNGRTQLYYMVDHSRPLQNVVSSLNVDGFLTVVTNLFTTIIHARSNGFLSCQNIEIGFDRIYVEPTTLRVSLIYVPLNCHIHPDYDAFENDLRTSLIRLINSLPQLASARITRLSIALANTTMTLEDVISDIGDSKREDATVGPDWKTNFRSRKNVAKLKAINAPSEFVLTINKDEYILGKNPYAVDGVIQFNQAISRVHCKINKVPDGYVVTDLGSANGTFVNGVRMKALETRPLCSGDVLRLANSEFQLILR